MGVWGGVDLTMIQPPTTLYFSLDTQNQTLSPHITDLKYGEDVLLSFPNAFCGAMDPGLTPPVSSDPLHSLHLRKCCSIHSSHTFPTVFYFTLMLQKSRIFLLVCLFFVFF